MADPTVDKNAERPSPHTEAPPESAGQTDATTPKVTVETDRLPYDRIFGLLSNERRRLVIKYMAENGPEATLSELAVYIASIENDKPVAAINSSERKRVYVGLYQVHLPKLDDANVIDYNQRRGAIDLRPEADQLLTYLTVDRAGSDRTESLWQRLIPAPLLALWAKFVVWNPIDIVRRR